MMNPLSNKPLLIMYAPVDIYAGYGARGRDLAHSLIKLKEPEYDVRFLSCRWGGLPGGALSHDNEKDKAILDRILPGGHIPKQPDVWIMCTVPNEMQKLGTKYNICITAAVETHIATPEFIEGCNKADLVIVSSNFGKEVLQRSTFDHFDSSTKQLIDKLSLKTKVEVLFEGLDLTKYHKSLESYPDPDLDLISESFCFLTVAHWTGGELFFDRKNLAILIKVFLETFKNKKNVPALILKTAIGATSIMDREAILDRIETIRKEVKATTLPNIYLLHGDFTDEEINELYSHPKVKAFALFSNEGFGRPFLEFSVQQKPILSSNYSGHVDFLNPEFTVQVGGTIAQIHPSVAMKAIIPENGMWYYPNASEMSQALKGVFENYDDYLEGAKRQAYKSKTEFSMEKMDERFKEILDTYLPKVSQPISIKLPTLKPIANLQTESNG